jgi:hypothetical protein
VIWARLLNLRIESFLSSLIREIRVVIESLYIIT